MKKIILFTFIFTLAFVTVSFGATQKIVSRIEDALETISGWIVKISTPAAAVAIGSGLIIKKFSFGDEERIMVGKKLFEALFFPMLLYL